MFRGGGGRTERGGSGGEAFPATEECTGGRGQPWLLCSYPDLAERWTDGEGRLLSSGRRRRELVGIELPCTVDHGEWLVSIAREKRG